MPAHHKLEAYLDEYLDVAGIRSQGRSPLFRSTIGKTGVLTGFPMHRIDVWRMIRRRVADAGMSVKIGCHTFRATGITAYLEAGGTLENAQAMAAHESPRTTKLYDRTADVITLDVFRARSNRRRSYPQLIGANGADCLDFGRLIVPDKLLLCAAQGNRVCES